MAEPRVKLNAKTIARLLKSPKMRAAVNSAAQSIGNDAGADARVFSYQSDRKSAAVTVPAAQQTRDGALTRSAGRAGHRISP